MCPSAGVANVEGRKSLALVGNRDPDCPEQSLYILKYPGSRIKKGLQKFENVDI